jgi:sulfur carrier protein
VKLVVNGEERELPPGTKVGDLLPAEQRGVAVALDGEVVPRGEWPVLELREGQKVELLEAKAGG